MGEEYYQGVPCGECKRLAENYRALVRIYREILDQAGGAVRADAILGGQKSEALLRRCMTASDAFLKHVKSDHPAPKRAS